MSHPRIISDSTILYKEYIKIKSLIIHKVGNKLNQDEIILSKSPVNLEDKINSLLLNYFFSSFRLEELYQFHHDINLSYNEVYSCISKIFDNPNSMFSQSVNLAKHLYNQSTHPKVKSGEFYVVYFKDCIFDGMTLDAIGLFKSENKDVFIEVEQVNQGFQMKSRQGININKIDKGCLIFNTEKEKGYVLAIIDNTNKGSEAQYWKDDFLSVLHKKNDYHQTNQFLGITKQFVTKQLDEDFDLNKADKINFLNRSVDYFKKHETFDKNEFEEEVFGESNVIESFRKFDQTYRQENEIVLSDNFVISDQAVKKQSRVFKSILKLDKNFHIYIHGNRELLEQGTDENGRKYYKIYYENES
jgi:hypothetical protein